MPELSKSVCTIFYISSILTFVISIFVGVVCRTFWKFWHFTSHGNGMFFIEINYIICHVSVRKVVKIILKTNKNMNNLINIDLTEKLPLGIWHFFSHSFHWCKEMFLVKISKICLTGPTIRHIRHCIQMFWK